MKRIIIPEYMEPVVELYYKNGAKQLYSMVDKILYRLHFVDIDKNDFYSLANEVFMYTVRDYDTDKPFDGFLYSCLYKKFCSEMSKRNCEKRKADKLSISIDTPVSDDESLTIGDMLAGGSTVEKEIFGEENIDSYKIENYLNNLTKRQRKIVELLAASYKAWEIQRILHITQKEYEDAMLGIHSYENISLLF